MNAKIEFYVQSKIHFHSFCFNALNNLHFKIIFQDNFFVTSRETVLYLIFSNHLNLSRQTITSIFYSSLFVFVDTYGVCICIKYNHLNILVVGTNVFACGAFWCIAKVPIG